MAVQWYETFHQIAHGKRPGQTVSKNNGSSQTLAAQALPSEENAGQQCATAYRPREDLHTPWAVEWQANPLHRAWYFYTRRPVKCVYATDIGDICGDLTLTCLNIPSLRTAVYNEEQINTAALRSIPLLRKEAIRLYLKPLYMKDLQVDPGIKSQCHYANMVSC